MIFAHTNIANSISIQHRRLECNVHDDMIQYWIGNCLCIRFGYMVAATTTATTTAAVTAKEQLYAYDDFHTINPSECLLCSIVKIAWRIHLNMNTYILTYRIGHEQMNMDHNQYSYTFASHFLGEIIFFCIFWYRWDYFDILFQRRLNKMISKKLNMFFSILEISTSAILNLIVSSLNIFYLSLLSHYFTWSNHFECPSVGGFFFSLAKNGHQKYDISIYIKFYYINTKKSYCRAEKIVYFLSFFKKKPWNLFVFLCFSSGICVLVFP